MFKTREDALTYLRQCSKVIIPSKFTYWCHSGQVKADKNHSDNPKYSKLWEEVPSETFTVKKEMSMLSKRDRLQYLADYGYAPTSYAGVDGQENFQIKVMMPRMNLTDEEFASLGKDDKYKQQLHFAYRGLGDGRHPKLPNKTQVHIFGQMNYDEMSKETIQTPIGVRDEDLIAYASEVKKEIAEQAKKGMITDSSFEIPEKDSEIIEKKEPFVMGDNIYQKQINKTETQEEKAEEKAYDLISLREKIDAEYKQWTSSNDPIADRYKTIDQAKQARLKFQRAIGGIPDISADSGEVHVNKYNTSSSQKNLLHLMNTQSKDLSKSIERYIDTKPGNYIHYATNNYCDLEAIDSVLPQVEERLNDLKNYEKNVGTFETTTIEQQTIKKPGLLGLLGAKKTVSEVRPLTTEELQVRKINDETKLNIDLAEGTIDKNTYDKTNQSIERLYGADVKSRKVEKVPKTEIEEEQEQINPKPAQEDLIVIQDLDKTKKQANDQSQNSETTLTLN